MRAPAFWWRDSPSWPAQVLRPAALLYGTLAARRMRRPGRPGPCPVICVGNFTVGGAGKTPTALALGELLQQTSIRPAFLTRGYGGRLGGPVAVDPARHTAADVGDEALLLARLAPTVVSRDRRAGADLCASLGAGAIIMDDGLQNPALVKDLSLAVVDGKTGVGNGLCLPAGPLRAPLVDQWSHVDAVVIVETGAAAEAAAQEAQRRNKRILGARLVPDPTIAARLRGQRVLAFAGIGRPDKLFTTLESCGAVLAARRSFPDHHAYRTDELSRLEAEARDQDCLLVTTEKDWVRLAGSGAPQSFLERVTALPVRLVFEEPERLRDLVATRLLGQARA